MIGRQALWADIGSVLYYRRGLLSECRDARSASLCRRLARHGDMRKGWALTRSSSALRTIPSEGKMLTPS